MYYFDGAHDMLNSCKIQKKIQRAAFRDPVGGLQHSQTPQMHLLGRYMTSNTPLCGVHVDPPLWNKFRRPGAVDSLDCVTMILKILMHFFI